MRNWRIMSTKHDPYFSVHFGDKFKMCDSPVAILTLNYRRVPTYQTALMNWRE
jgi:hypothetical protein